ncbi:MAG: chorismate synthase [Oligoflexia bacterium]|nr:chorismate synthase [Oligoflexia bacterium]
MNSFGRLFRISILGESHGDCIGLLIDGLPAGIDLNSIDFASDMKRRNPSVKGTTSRKEADIPVFKSGVLNGITTGAPLLLLVENADVKSGDYEKNRFLPRPGHADFTAYTKFGGLNDYRGGGHFSGRLTAALVAAGCIAKNMLKGISVTAVLSEAGGGRDIDSNIEAAIKDGDSVGGIVECSVAGLEAGLGEPFFDSVESRIGHMIFSIPGIKGVEFGSGFKCASMRGSECNDVITGSNGKTSTNHSGGINGGITNGNEIFFRVAARPTPSIAAGQDTVNLKSLTKDKVLVKGRHDACFAVRLPVIVEACTAIVLADFLMLEGKIKRVMR